MDYAHWKQARGDISEEQQPPQWIGKGTAKKTNDGQGVQTRAFAHKAAVPPVTSFGLQPDDHLSETTKFAAKPLPNEKPRTTDPDPAHVAEMMVKKGSVITEARCEAVNAVRRLRRGWRSHML